jgi:hypothetical protein
VSHDMLFLHSRTCGRMQTKKASDDQRPRIMILAGERSTRNGDMAAPERRDLFPIS